MTGAGGRSSRRRPVVITGGAGFIGSNLADSLLSSGTDVILFDNLSRAGVAGNVDWLLARHKDRVALHTADVRDTTAVAEAINDASAVVHFAAQVAVTESLESPLEDFTINAAGTLHLLEALRRKKDPTPVVFASTNKVYGSLGSLQLQVCGDRYVPAEPQVRNRGLDETLPLQFCTPYGCSKGAADQYVLDYANCFGLPAVVLRMSCIYGPRQLGTEDQGWLAHFLIRALKNEPILLFGSGHQVRDVLHIDDAVRAYRMVLADTGRLSGCVFNLGGGTGNAVSLLAVLDEIERILERPVVRLHEPARTGDQRYYVADTGRLTGATGWRPRIGWREGVTDLLRWLQANRSLVGIPAAAREWSFSA